jgi:hypothetical protein
MQMYIKQKNLIVAATLIVLNLTACENKQPEEPAKAVAVEVIMAIKQH